MLRIFNSSQKSAMFLDFNCRLSAKNKLTKAFILDLLQVLQYYEINWKKCFLFVSDACCYVCEKILENNFTPMSAYLCWNVAQENVSSIFYDLVVKIFSVVSYW